MSWTVGLVACAGRPPRGRGAGRARLGRRARTPDAGCDSRGSRLTSCFPTWSNQILDLALPRRRQARRWARRAGAPSCPSCHRAGHRDCLPLTPREEARFSRECRRPRCPATQAQCLCLRGHPQGGRAPTTASRRSRARRNLPSEEDVLRDRQLGCKGEILVDDLDPLVARLAGGEWKTTSSPSMKQGRPPLGGTAPQRILRSVDLPYSLSPTRPDDLARA